MSKEVGSLGLSRHQDESIVIGELGGAFYAIVTVRRFEGNRVWLNISAPKDVPVNRAERLPAPPLTQ